MFHYFISPYHLPLLTFFPHNSLAEEFLLDSSYGYRYLTYKNVDVPSTDDSDEYRQLIESLDIMGIGNDDQNGEWPKYRLQL